MNTPFPTMKPTTIRNSFTAACIATALSAPAFAIEAPEDNTPPPAAAAPAPQDAANQAEAPKQEKAFLGIFTSPVPEMLAEHLGLENGDGVAVQRITPDSPAAKAGLTLNDIITRANGKDIHSQESLAEAVSGQKPGDVIHLDIIHKGKPSKLDVTLGNRPNDLDELGANPLVDQLPLDGVPKEMADRIRGAIKGGGIQLQFGGGGGVIAPEKIEEMKKQMEKMGGNFNFHAGTSIQMADGEGSVEMKSTNDGKEVTLRDQKGKVTWSGPWDTEQDKEAAPEDVRKRLDKFNIDGMGANGGMLKIIPKMFNPDQAAEENPK